MSDDRQKMQFPLNTLAFIRCLEPKITFYLLNQYNRIRVKCCSCNQFAMYGAVLAYANVEWRCFQYFKTTKIGTQ